MLFIASMINLYLFNTKLAKKKAVKKCKVFENFSSRFVKIPKILR
jgi:hypothetical protein